MRDIGHECWPSCDRCTRQVPTLDVNRRLTLGWTQPAPGVDFCATCSQDAQQKRELGAVLARMLAEDYPEGSAQRGIASELIHDLIRKALASDEPDAG